MDRCDECGFVYDDVNRDDVAPALRELSTRYERALADQDEGVLRAHPVPNMWSALEYACHIRDVYRVQRERVLLALSEEQPTFAPMRRDERVAEERYNEQQPARVAREINGAAASLIATLESLDGDGWSRTGIYNFPQRRVRTVEWIGRHTVHEGKHHLADIERLVGSAHANGQ